VSLGEQWEKDICECGSEETIIDYTTGELICANCGMVLREDMIDDGPEWREFNRDERQRRRRVQSINMSYARQGIGSHISSSDLSSIPDGEERAQMNRLRWKHYRNGESASRNLYIANKAMESMKRSGKLKVTRVVEDEAMRLYKMAYAEGIIRGRTIKGILAACIYVACRIHEHPTSIRTIADIIGMNHTDVARLYRLIVDELDIDIPVHKIAPYIGKLANNAKLPPELELYAKDVLDYIYRNNRILLSGKHPKGMAASLLYIAAIKLDYRLTQVDLSYYSGITEVTIRNRYQEILRYLNESSFSTDRASKSLNKRTPSSNRHSSQLEKF
jgi:transcription initiation factor TFIIB